MPHRNPARTRRREAILVDVRGTIKGADCGGKGLLMERPRPINPEAKLALQTLYARGYLIMLVTGMPVDEAHEIADELEIPEVVIAADGATKIFRWDEPDRVDEMVPREELVALYDFRVEASQILRAMGATVDDRASLGQVAAYWDDSANFDIARVDWYTRIAGNHKIRSLLEGRPDGRKALLQIRWQAATRSLHVVPQHADKANAVRWCRERGIKVIAAAGDVLTDKPMLEAAEILPILTRTEEGTTPPAEMIELLRRRGRGYMPNSDRPNGRGLADGLQYLLRMLDGEDSESCPLLHLPMVY